MASSKISDLTSITGVNTASGDLFPVVDIDALATKKITRDELISRVITDTGNVVASQMFSN